MSETWLAWTHTTDASTGGGAYQSQQALGETDEAALLVFKALHTRLRRESTESLKWFIHTLGHSPQRPLALSDMLQCLAAADACAKGQTVGIGGWVITAAWFGGTWSIEDIRKT